MNEFDLAAILAAADEEGIGQPIQQFYRPQKQGGVSDTTAPTVVITSSTASPSLWGTVAATVTFSEAMTGFVVGDITISAGGSLANFATSDNIIFTVDWTLASGANTMDIAAGVATDAAGNDNEAATQFPMTYGVTCPAITPTLGAEALANPGFEGTYDTEGAGIDIAPDWNNSAMDAGVDTASKETTIVHGGSASQKIIVDAVAEGITTAANTWIAGNWYQSSVWAYRASGTGTVLMLDAGAAIILPAIGTTGAWVQAVGTARCPTTRPVIIRSFVAAGFNGYIDDASVKIITPSSMITLLGSLSGRDGTYTCKPTATAYTQAGMDIAFLNTSNFVRAVVYRSSSDTAKLLKYISGVWTEVITGAITYSAAAELKVVISGTGYSLYYNGVQVGTTQTIADTLGEGVYGFNSYAGNTVGVVTANP